MGRAIVEGAVRAGTVHADRTVVLDPDPAKHPAFAALGCAAHAETSAALAAFVAAEATHGPGVVLLAVKPQMLPAVAGALGEGLRRVPRLLLSILAGIPTPRLAGALGGRVVRLMPNTPAQIGKGITALCPGPGATREDLGTARTLFESVGRVIDLPEGLLDAFTGVAGSGPAYVFYLAEAMAAGAEAVGFSRGQALELTRATIAGAAGLLEASPETEPGELRAMVTSKGGTTAAATAVLDARGVVDAVREAITAARDRGRELGGGREK
jgi:pyrroline-5-carboxylate reductase